MESPPFCGIINLVSNQISYSNERKKIHMLTRNCVKKLLKPNDINTRVTVISKEHALDHPFNYKQKWLNIIRESLGKGIVSSTDKQFIDITPAVGYYYSRLMTGKELMAKIQDTFHAPVSLRISIPGWPTRSWVILLEQDLEVANK